MATRTGLMARLTYSGKDLVRVEAVPIVIEWYSQPRLAAPEEAAPILNAIGLSNLVLLSSTGNEQPR